MLLLINDRLVEFIIAGINAGAKTVGNYLKAEYTAWGSRVSRSSF